MRRWIGDNVAKQVSDDESPELILQSIVDSQTGYTEKQLRQGKMKVKRAYNFPAKADRVPRPPNPGFDSAAKPKKKTEPKTPRIKKSKAPPVTISQASPERLAAAQERMAKIKEGLSPYSAPITEENWPQGNKTS